MTETTAIDTSDLDRALTERVNAIYADDEPDADREERDWQQLAEDLDGIVAAHHPDAVYIDGYGGINCTWRLVGNVTLRISYEDGNVSVWADAESEAR